MRDSKSHGALVASLTAKRRLGAVSLAVALAALTVSACGSSESSAEESAGSSVSSSPAETSTSTSSSSADAGDSSSASSDGSDETEVNFAGPGGALGDAMKAIFADFTAQTGIKVNYESGLVGENFAKLQAQVQGNDILTDLQMDNDLVHGVGIAQNLWAKLDLCLVPNAGPDNVSKLALEPDGTAPVTLMTVTGLMYEKTIFEQKGWAPPTSWKDLLDPKYASCVIPLDPAGGSNAQVMLNYVLTGSDKDWQPALAEWQKIASQIPSTAKGEPAASQLMQQKVGCLSTSTAGHADVAGPDVAFVVPTEGDVMINNHIQLIQGGPHPIAAQKALNFLLSAESESKFFAQSYTPTNVNAQRGTDAVSAATPTIADIENEGGHRISADAYDDVDAWSNAWSQLFTK